jgi:hypothetical protein
MTGEVAIDPASAAAAKKMVLRIENSPACAAPDRSGGNLQQVCG